MARAPAEVTASRATLEDGSDGVSVKLVAADWELNVWFSAAEVARFHDFEPGRWDDRASVRLGQSAGSPVFWSRDQDGVAIMVGRDDETWDFSVLVSGATLDVMRRAVATELGDQDPATG